jgi:OmpA-OmpF porin, OOP family
MKALFYTLMLIASGFLPLNLSAQRIQEWGLLYGLSHYQGDLSEPHIELSETRKAGGMFYRMHLGPSWHLRGQVTAGQFSGDDRHSPARAFRQYRFHSSWVETGIMGEWKWRGRRSPYYVGVFRRHLSPYFFAGLALTRVWGKAECYRPECLEGVSPLSREPGQSWFFALPYGLGLRWEFAPSWSAGMELGHRPVFSDHLEGVSVTGNPRRRDWYLLSGISVSYLIGQKQLRDVNCH